jgi:transcriptional/translational regulatory protein YebC/TACO1
MGMWMFRKRKPYGEYPACDHLNVALRYLLDSADKNRIPIEEIVYAITKSNGYFYDDVKDALTKNNFYGFGEREDNAM